jgi:hypothetical protein
MRNLAISAAALTPTLSQRAREEEAPSTSPSPLGGEGRDEGQILLLPCGEKVGMRGRIEEKC